MKKKQNKSKKKKCNKNKKQNKQADLLQKLIDNLQKKK